MIEKPEIPFDPEASAFRTALVGHLKIDKASQESIELLQEWAMKQEDRVMAGEISAFDWDRDAAEIYFEAGYPTEAVWVLKTALYKALQEDNRNEILYFRSALVEAGEDPEDLSEIED